MAASRQQSLTAEEQNALLHGIALIAQGSFFEAHEVIEHVWAVCHSPNRRFLQAIIHVAVGCHHQANGNSLGMERQFLKAIGKLREYPAGHAGVDTSHLVSQLHQALAATEGTGWNPRSLWIVVNGEETSLETKRGEKSCGCPSAPAAV